MRSILCLLPLVVACGPQEVDFLVMDELVLTDLGSSVNSDSDYARISLFSGERTGEFVDDRVVFTDDWATDVYLKGLSKKLPLTLHHEWVWPDDDQVPQSDDEEPVFAAANWSFSAQVSGDVFTGNETVMVLFVPVTYATYDEVVLAEWTEADPVALEAGTIEDGEGLIELEMSWHTETHRVR